MNLPIGLVAIVFFVVIAELGRALVAKLFGYPPERHAIPIMKLPGIRGTTGFRLALILAGPVTMYLAVAVLAFGFYRCHGQTSPETATVVASTSEGFDAVGKVAAEDVILEVEGAPFAGGAARLSEQVNAKHGAPVALTVDRGGSLRTVTITPKERDGRWLLGVRLVSKREYSTGQSLRDAVTYPLVQAELVFKGVIELVKGSEEADPGGPVRIAQELERAFETSLGELIVQLGMIFGTYALIALVLFDLGRALFLILFRS